MQRRIEAPPPFAYRSRDLRFFLSRIVALLLGIDDRTAEGRRRVRRLALDMEGERIAEPPAAHLMIRDGAESLEQALSANHYKGLEQARDALADLSEDPNATGEAFHGLMENLENLPARIAWIRRNLPCLRGLNTFRFLNGVGYPCLVPDQPSRKFFFRLGLVDETGGVRQKQLAACALGEEIARDLQRPVNEIDLWVHAFTGTLPDASAEASLCRATPQCRNCPLQPYCQYYRFQRPPAAESTAPLSVKQWRPGERPRERLMEHGAHALDDVELLAIVLRTGAGKMNVLDLTRHLLNRFGDLRGIEDASLEELQTVHGIGRMKAVELKAIFELGRRQAYQPLTTGERIDSSAKVFRAYRGRFLRVLQEEFILLMLNNKNQVIREEVISRGGLDASIVHPREVFKAAIRASAAAVIFIHNHPSGDPTPSHDDFVITQRLEEAAGFLKIRVLDHIVVGAESYYSFTEGEVIRAEEIGMDVRGENRER